MMANKPHGRLDPIALPRPPKPTNPPPQAPGHGKDTKPGTHSDHELHKAKKAARELRRVIKSPCNRPPERPKVPRLRFYAHESKTDLEFTGRMRWDDVTVDTSGQDITLERWEAIIVATDKNGNIQDTDAEGQTHTITNATVTVVKKF